ncbi:MAG TPA: 2-hydroxy-3-oxopropionate reductase [Thermomicrobiales bacterium]|nr:2-hydroxy-3-oxopropionate reductase [Thermomicrobiales bacterium]HRA31004.1 2-hydroxy-3-oxopropionate reductase [Thermomicrobiales bacterium]
MAERVGFIGLGIMGRPMVRNLAKAGYEIVVYNRSQDDVDEIVAEVEQATAARSARAVAADVDIVITMLPDSPEVSDVVFGEAGILAEMDAGDLLIDMSTIAPATAIAVSDALIARGASALDAPVSGGDKGAIAGTLSIMAGGSAADFDRARPLFEAMGKTIIHVGGPGAGQTVKACNQIVVAIHYAAVSEALLLGAMAGVDPEKVVQVLSGGLAASRVMEMRGPGMIAHQFEPGFRIDLHRKDLNIAMSTGREFHAPLPVSALVTQLYESMAARGDGQLDHSALITLYEAMAGFTVGDEG